MDYFASSLQHILAELERIDVLLRAQVWRARQILQVDEHFQGLYVADEEVDRLLGEPIGLPRWATDGSPFTQNSLFLPCAQRSTSPTRSDDLPLTTAAKGSYYAEVDRFRSIRRFDRSFPGPA